MRIKLKKYYIKNLLDKYENIIERCHLIEKVSKEMDFIPETKLTINDPFIIYEQNLINKKSFRSLSNFNKKKLLLSFAHNLDLLNKKRFVHGDLNITNIIYDGNKLNLIDLEPSFKQIKFNKRVTMSYAISKSLNDLKYKTISSETDKIGFFLICKDLLEIPFLKGNIRDVIKKRKNGYNFLPIKECKFITFKFSEIYQLVTEGG